jgi:hypothetical protein
MVKAVQMMVLGMVGVMATACIASGPRTEYALLSQRQAVPMAGYDAKIGALPRGPQVMGRSCQLSFMLLEVLGSGAEPDREAAVAQALRTAGPGYSALAPAAVLNHREIGWALAVPLINPLRVCSTVVGTAVRAPVSAR